jgi:hypothetical protein
VDGDGFYKEKRKYRNKYNLIVIRVNHKGNLVNARPCHNCVDMLKACGIKNIFYSTQNGDIICEKVNQIVSINSSSVSRLIERTLYNAPRDNIGYYTYLLLKNFPRQIKKNNLNNFLTHNIKNVLPNFTWNIKNEKIIFYNCIGVYVLTSFIY